MNRLLVVCAAFGAGLAIGGAASWLILDDGARAAQPHESVASPDRAPAVEAASYLAPVSESRGVVEPIRARSFKDVRGAPAEDLGGAPLVGTGKITGRVRTDKGEALAGVLVRAEFQGEREDRWAQEWRTGDGAPPDHDMQTKVQRFIEEAERGEAMRRDATTGANGEFAIDGLLEDRYSLRAYLKGYVLALDQQSLEWQARPGAVAEFTASQVMTLPVDVRLADGTVPKRASLHITVRNSNRGETWRPETPELRLGVGSYAISATAGDRDEWRSEPQNVVLKEGPAPGPLVLRLTARTGIHGRVKVPKGYAMDHVSIFALRYAGTAVPDENALRRGQNQYASPWNGFEFNFHDLAAGTWLLGAGTWESVFATKTVEVGAGKVTEVVLEITDAGATGLVVHVVGPDNAPVADASLRVDSQSGGFEPAEGFNVRPKKDGAWVVSPKKESATEGRDWMLNVHSDRYGDKSVAMPAATTGELRIEMAEPATLDVTITGYAGSGLEGRLRIEVKPLQAGKEVRRMMFHGNENPISPDGKQTIKALQPGRYRVELHYARERWQSSAIDRVEIDVGSGANATSIAIPAIYTLTVVANGEPADATINLQQIGTGGTDERFHHSKIGTDGTAVFEGLAAGTYRLQLWNQKIRRSRVMKVTVPAAGPVAFKEDAETTLVVKVADTEGYLASVGLQVGDVITGADGSAFDGSRPATQVLNGLMLARKELKLSLLRAGKQLEATVDSEKFSAATNHGRTLEGGSR